MDTVCSFMKATLFLVSSEEWANFGQGLGALLTGVAAFAALILGVKKIERMMISEAIKVKMNDFMESNKTLSKKAQQILDRIINDDDEDALQLTKEQLDRFCEMAQSLHKSSYGAADVSQTFAFLLMCAMRDIQGKYTGKFTVLSYSSTRRLMLLCVEKVLSSSLNAVVSPDKIKISPLHKPKKQFKKLVKKSQSGRIEGMPTGVDLNPSGSIVSGFFEVFRSCIDSPRYLSFLSYALNSNEFIRISLEANKIDFPAFLSFSSGEEVLGMKQDLWMVGFKLSTQIFPAKIEFVEFFYMAADQNFNFVKNIDSIRKIVEPYEAPFCLPGLGEVFSGATFSKEGEDIIKIKIQRDRCRSSIFNKLYKNKYFIFFVCRLCGVKVYGD